MNMPTRTLQDVGQSIWLDNITRDLLTTGALRRYIDALSVTGLTSNPTIFDHAITSSLAYDEAIRDKRRMGLSGEQLVFDLALEDVVQAAELFRPIHVRTNGVDGWVSIEVSPSLAHNARSTLVQARQLHTRANRPNLFIKIPGTPEGLAAIEEATFAGIPVNVTLLFSREQYLAAAEAHLCGVERRLAAGLNPAVGSVASLFVSRWDVAVQGTLPSSLSNRLGIAMARNAYRAYRDFIATPRYLRVLNAGGRPQRLLFASTGTKDARASDVLYVEALAAPLTVNTMPQATLDAFADHGQLGPVVPVDGAEDESLLAEIARAGVDVGGLAARLQVEGAASFVRSWNSLLSKLAVKADILEQST